MILRSQRARFARGRRQPQPQGRCVRGTRDLVVMLDGTLATLNPERLTSIGHIHQLLSELPADRRPCLFYEEGIQWTRRRDLWPVMTGQGIDRQIQRAYGWLACRYRPGDRIFLVGYSRGAFAVRSLAGIVDRIGLLKARAATERNIREIYRHYRENPASGAAQRFAAGFCHARTEIQALAVFDTVKALGIRLPLLWQLTEPAHAFHSPELSHNVRHGYHALALNECRQAFAPVLWSEPEGWQGRVEQVWFQGTHGDVGGQLGGREASRPLANIPLCWMLGRLQEAGLTLPEDWQVRFPCDAAAPRSGNWHGWNWLFLHRRRRKVGREASEWLHPTTDGHVPRRLSGVLPPLEA